MFPFNRNLLSLWLAALTLYYSSSCPYSKQVLDYLKETGREIPLVDVKKDPQAKERLKQYGTPAQVPCLVIDEQPLYNSGAIIDYLKEHP